MATTRGRADGDLLRHPRRATVAAASMLAVLAAMAVLVAADTAAPPLLFRVDAWWQGLMLPSPGWAVHASDLLKLLGSGWLMVPLRVGVAGYLLGRKRYADLAAWLLGWALADLATSLLKPGIGRLRPDGSDFSSFPSGHAKTAAQVAVGMVLVLTSPWRSRMLPWTLALAWIIAMAASRTVLNEHYLSDVVAGTLLGTGCAVLAAAGVQRARDKRAA